MALAKVGMLCLARINQIDLDCRQGFFGFGRLRSAFHDGVDAIYPQTISFLCFALYESGLFAGFLDFLARPFRFLSNSIPHLPHRSIFESTDAGSPGGNTSRN